MRVKCLAKEHNTMTRLEPGPLDPESSALTARPPRLPQLGIRMGKDGEDTTVLQYRLTRKKKRENYARVA